MRTKIKPRLDLMFELTVQQLRLIIKDSQDRELKMTAIRELRRRTKIYNQVNKVA